MISSIPFTAPVAPTPHGLRASPYWWTWLAYLLVLPMAYALMPGQLRESVKALWAPVAAFLSRCSVLMEVLRVLVGFTCCMGLAEALRWDNWPQDGDEGYRQPRRLAYMGFDTPIKT